MRKKALVQVADSRLPKVMPCLKEAGYRLTIVEDIEEGRTILPTANYVLVVFEFQPGPDFVDCIDDIRSLSGASILALVNGEDYEDIEPYLMLADDAMLTDFDPKELMVRARALAKHPHAIWRQKSEENGLQFGELHIFPTRYTVSYNRRPIKLTPTEYSILALMAAHPGQIFTRNQINDAIHNDYVDIDVDKTISNHIGRLRRKLAKVAKRDFFPTEWAVGYYFDPE